MLWKKWKEYNPPAKIQLFSVEKYPLPFSIIEEVFNKEESIKFFAEEFLHFYKSISSGYNRFAAENGNIELTLIVADAADIQDSFKAKIDVWFLDGFSPAKNPEMWTREIFEFMKRNSKEGASFSTYTTAGFVKESLVNVGFVIEKVEGFGKKKHMLKGNIPITRQKISDKPWFRIPKYRFKTLQAIIIGGGLAGTSLAFALSQKGFSSTIIEKEDKISSGASGNLAGMFAPLLTGDISELSEWSITAYKKFVSFLDSYSAQFPDIFKNSGVFQVISSKEEFNRLKNALKHSNMNLTDVNFLSQENEIMNGFEGVFFPRAGWVNPISLAQAYLKIAGNFVVQRLSTRLISIQQENANWKITLSNGEVLESEILIFANSYHTSDFIVGLDEKKKVRGQLLYYPSDKFPIPLDKVILHEDGYIIPNINGFHLIGATFDPTDSSCDLNLEHNVYLLQKLKKIIPTINPEVGKSMTGRVSFRAMSRDHLPIIGPVPDIKSFTEEYSDLWKSNIYKDYEDGKYLPGLFVSSSHGSKGILNSYLAAIVLSEIISNGNSQFSLDLLQRVNPSRFLIQRFINKS